MPLNLNIILCVIAVALFGVSVADPPEPKCSEKSKDFRDAGDQVRKTFKVLVKEAIDHPDPDALTIKLDKFEKELNNLVRVGNETCSQQKYPANFSLFRNLVEFSLRNVTILQELNNVEAFKCIGDSKNNITDCVKDALRHSSNETERTLYGKLVMKGNLQLNHMELRCPQTTHIKTCTVDVLKKCKPGVVTYVESLFNFIHDRLCKNLKANTSGTGELNGSAFYGMLACGLLVLNL